MSQSASPPEPGLWASLREALQGSQRDFTEGSMRRAVFLLAVPMVAEMLMESLFTVVDIFFVSKLGAAAVATVGLTEAYLSLVYVLAIGLSVSATALVARRTGENDPDGAAVAAVQVIGLALVVGVAIGLVGWAFGAELLSLMGASDQVVEVGSQYTRIMLGGCVTVVLLFVLNAAFRGAGDAALAMRSLWLANAVNIVLDPCLIFGWGPFPEMGLTGAAVATTIGRGIGVAYQVVMLVRPGRRLSVAMAHARLDPLVMRTLLPLASMAMLQGAIESASWIGLIRILAGFGSDAVAGYTIAIRVAIFALLPSFGLANAAATLVGQNLGAAKPERAERSAWLAAGANSVFLGSVSLFFIIFPEPIVGSFTDEAAIIPYAVVCLRTVSFGFLFYAFGMVLVQSFNGAGDTRTPMLLNLVCFWLIKIPGAYVLAIPLGLGPLGVFVAVTVAYSTIALAAVVLFRQGHWKLRHV